MVCTSLSPRPDRLHSTSLSLGSSRASLIACATASAGFQRRQDAFGTGQAVESGQRLLVGHAQVLGSAHVLQESVLRADAGIVQTGGDRMGFGDLAVVVADHVGAVAVQHADPARRQRRRVAPGVDALARRFRTDDAHARVVEEGVEQPDGVTAATHAGGDGIRQPAVFGQHLRARLAADHGVEVAHHARVRVGAGHGADDVEGVAHVGHPVAHRLVQRVLQRRRAGGHRHHRRAQQLHPVHIDLLALDVGGAHVDHALQAQPRGHGGAGDAVLAGAGLRDDAGLAHPRRQQRLADGVVDLVRAGVVQVLALEQDLRPAHLAAQALGVVDRAGAADVVRQVLVEGGDEGRIDARGVVGIGQLLQRAHQSLGDEAAAVAAEVAVGIGPGVEIDGRGGRGLGAGSGHAEVSGVGTRAAATPLAQVETKWRAPGGRARNKQRRYLTAAAGTRRHRRSERPKGARGRLEVFMAWP